MPIDFRERGKEREGQKHRCKREISMLLLIYVLSGDYTHNPDMCPDWELNQGPFALQDNAQPNEPHQSGPF